MITPNNFIYTMRLWWDGYKILSGKNEDKKLFELLDKLVLNAKYKRNQERLFGSEYYGVVVYILNNYKKK